MFKLFFAAAVVVALAIASVSAGDGHGNDGSSAAAAPATKKEAKTAAGDERTQPAERFSQTRRYSYEPSYRAYYPGAIDGFYAGGIDRDRRIIGSYGQRPASDKVLGKY